MMPNKYKVESVI
uniref:Uncharacterized protein n=1 Tax=Arundo donax TaxID=35708 RepID=A0A0A8XZX3_ARUDO